MLTSSYYYPPSPPLSMTKTTNMDSTSYLNLEKVVQVYGNQPELLELILSSKVEEDRRRAEEAKLRRKEIDYMLQHKKTTSLPPISPNKTVSLPRLTPTASTTNSTYKRKNSNSIEMLLSSPSDLKLPTLKKRSWQEESRDNHAAGSAPPSPSFSESRSIQKKRKREVQAITTIIETKEFPYNDDYLWKNNGNTVHKKSGYKSIYYKCSNSAKGCPVNKTVTFKENGQHLIKYRGDHLPECNRIKHISDL